MVYRATLECGCKVKLIYHESLTGYHCWFMYIVEPNPNCKEHKDGKRWW
jgi:hypothetical protein